MIKNFYLGLLSSLGLFVAGCGTAPVSPVQSQLSDLCEQYGIQFQMDNISQVITRATRAVSEGCRQ